MTQIRAMADAVIGCAMIIPGAKPIGRAMTKFVTRSTLIKRKNRQRVYNLLAGNMIPSEDIDTRVAIPGHPEIELNVRLGLADKLSSFWYYFGYDHYEVPVRRTLAALFEALPIGHRCHILDVGGNIGYFSLFLGSLAQDTSRASIHVFEPSPNVFKLLQRNLALNVGLPVTLNEAAVSDIAGEFQLFLAHEDFGHSGASLVAGTIEQIGAVTVKTVVLDDYVASLGDGKVAILKMDCEGVEVKALAGFEKTLERDSPHIVLEILPRYPNMPSDLAAQPFFSRYRKFQITDSGLIEHTEIRPDYDNRDWLFSVDPPAHMVRSASV